MVIQIRWLQAVNKAVDAKLVQTNQGIYSGARLAEWLTRDDAVVLVAAFGKTAGFASHVSNRERHGLPARAEEHHTARRNVDRP